MPEAVDVATTPGIAPSKAGKTSSVSMLFMFCLQIANQFPCAFLRCLQKYLLYIECNSMRRLLKIQPGNFFCFFLRNANAVQVADKAIQVFALYILFFLCAGSL